MLLLVPITAWLLYLRSSPPVWFDSACLLVPVGFVLVAYYVVRLIGALARCSLNFRQWRWYAATLLVILFFWGQRTDLPLRLRFERSRAAFEAAALELLDEGKVEFAFENRQIGSYFVRRVHVLRRERIVYFITSDFFLNQEGFVYSPLRSDLYCKIDGDYYDDFIITRALMRDWMTFVYSP